MAERGVTRAHVLATAQQLFQRQGFHATGMNQILAESQAPKGSMYHHFPGGKTQLAAESVGLGASELGEMIDAIIADSADPPSAIHTMAELLAARLEGSGFLDGCPITGVALDAGDNDPIREACRSGYDRWLTSITDALVDAGITRVQARELAFFILSALEGGLILARTRRETSGLIAVADRVADLIAAELAR
jgi:TetR/AcrR family transcriptional repressor of lmrAB and yxaGH operons